MGRCMLIAQSDDPELLEWLSKAAAEGGGFISALARAALVADWENYPFVRPILLVMRQKYRRFEPSDAVKAEVAKKPRLVIHDFNLPPAGE